MLDRSPTKAAFATVWHPRLPVGESINRPAIVSIHWHSSGYFRANDGEVPPHWSHSVTELALDPAVRRGGGGSMQIVTASPAVGISSSVPVISQISDQAPRSICPDLNYHSQAAGGILPAAPWRRPGWCDFLAVQMTTPGPAMIRRTSDHLSPATETTQSVGAT